MISIMNVAFNKFSVKSLNKIISQNLYNMSIKRCVEKRSIQVKRTPLYRHVLQILANIHI